MDERKRLGLLALVIGIVFAIFMSSGVHSLGMFGSDCYFIGQLDFNSACINKETIYFMWGVAVFLIIGGLLSIVAPVDVQKPIHDEPQQPRSGARQEPILPHAHDFANDPTRRQYDRDKWALLIKYDSEIQAAVSQVKPLGQQWVDELAASYLKIGDKAYLPPFYEVSSMMRREHAPHRSAYYASLAPGLAAANLWTRRR